MFQTPVKLLEYPKSSETAKIKRLHSASYFNAKLSRDGEGYFATLISRHNTKFYSLPSRQTNGFVEGRLTRDG